jgi:RHS repeat-associated protein
MINGLSKSPRFKNNFKICRLSQSSLVSGLLALFLVSSAIAQETNLETTGLTEPMANIKRAEDKDKLVVNDSDLLGDRIDMNTGSLSFSHTDVSLPGNSNLEVAFRRNFHSGHFGNTVDAYDGNATYDPNSTDFTQVGAVTRGEFGLGAWEVDVPYISTALARQRFPIVGDKPSGRWRADRCTADIEPTSIQIPGHVYWNGLQMNIPGQGMKQVLNNNGSLVSTADAIKITTDYWKISCITTIGASNGGGQGFIATAPNGDAYRFDKLVYRIDTPDIIGDSVGAATVKLSGPYDRAKAYLLATQVADVNGNWVRFEYDQYGTPTRIHSNDGRNISIAITDKRITSVTANARVWTYTYPLDASLVVTLPDERNWRFEGFYRTVLNPKPGYAAPGRLEGICRELDKQLTVTHPDGVTGVFTLSETYHGRSEVSYDVDRSQGDDRFCVNEGYRINYPGPTHTVGGVEVLPSANISRHTEVMSVKIKTLSGPGYPLATWGYEYENSMGQFVGATSIPDTKWSSVTNPLGERTVYHYNRRWDNLDSLIDTIEVFENGASSALQSIQYSYVIEQPVGNIDLPNANTATMEQARHQSNVVVTRGLDTFTTANTYQTDLSSDEYSFGLPTRITSTSSVSTGTRLRDYTYTHKPTPWVLGLMSTAKQNGVTTAGYAYDSLGRVITESRFGRTYATYGYHTIEGYKGALHWRQNNLEERTYFLDWKRGTPQQVKRPDDNSSSQVVDNNGWITEETDFLGECTKYSHNAVGRLTLIDPCDTQWTDTTVSYATTTSAEVSHVVAGMLKQTTTQGLQQQVVYYDGLLRPVITKTSDTSKPVTVRYQRTAYNALSQTTYQSLVHGSASTPNGSTMTYDALGRALVVDNNTTSGTSSYRYLSGNRIEFDDDKGNVTTSTYQAYGSPSYSQATRIASPQSVVTQMAYNVFGNTTSISQGGITEHRVYDTYQQLCKTVRPDVGNTAFKLNEIGQVTWLAMGSSISSSAAACDNEVTAAHKISYMYDVLGNMKNANFADTSPDVSYSYDKNNNLKTLTSGTVSHTYNYNSLNLLKDETLTLPGKTLSIDYGYDALGSLSSLTYPDGDVITYAPNGLGQPTQAIRNTRVANEPLADRTYVSGATYHPAGSIDGFTYGNGLIHKTTLNTRNVPSIIKDSKTGLTALHYEYAYDDNLNITKLLDRVDSSYSLGTDATVGLFYDGLDRLTSTLGGAGIGNSAIGYDVLGNITSYTSKGRNLTYNYNTTANRLTSVSGYASQPGEASTKYDSFSYDDRGNIYSNGDKTFTYNRANQLTTSGTNSYLYDGHNRRVKQTDTKGTSYSLYSQSGTLLYRESGDGGINYIYLGQKLIAKDGVIPENTGKQHYRPFGESIEGAKDDVGYTGHKFDTDLGLSYMQARYYDPVIGRFYSNDPVNALSHLGTSNGIHGFNRYTYGNNNPYKYVDPDGKSSVGNMFAKAFGYKNVTHANSQAPKDLSAAGQKIKGTINKGAGYTGAAAGIATVACVAVCQPAVPVLANIALASTVTGVVTSENPATEAVKELLTAGVGKKIDTAGNIIKATTKITDEVVDVGTEITKTVVSDELKEQVDKAND